MKSDKLLAIVLNHYKRITLLDSVASMLYWDHHVMMPRKGLNQRAEAVALIDRMSHDQMVLPEFVENVNRVFDDREALGEDHQAMLREIKRSVDMATRVPGDLVEAISRHASHSNAAWVEAREKSDFTHFAPFLEKMIDLRVEQSHALGFSEHPYDAMIDRFEPFADESYISSVFDDLKEKLVPFVKKITAQPRKSKSLICGPLFPEDKQRQFGLEVIRKFGFDFEAGRQDVSVHPFCVGVPGDVRITTRFYPNDLRAALFGMMHEAGHGLYEQGFDEEYFRTPLAEAVSLAVHESQSRTWENMVGRSLSFWKHFYPDLKETFPDALGSASVDEFYNAVNVVEGSLIRVEADELTYQLHIILRFEIEKELINRKVSVSDLPELWNRKMEEYLGIEVPSNAQGVLQDVHWSEGLFGYFPTYCLGNLYGAAFFEQLKQDIPDVDSRIEKGRFGDLLSWLRQNIHRHGKRYPAGELVERVTGKKLTAEPFMKYAVSKFGALYDL